METKLKHTYNEVVDFMNDLMDQNNNYKELKELKQNEDGDTYDDKLYDEIKRLFEVHNESEENEYYIYKGETNEL